MLQAGQRGTSLGCQPIFSTLLALVWMESCPRLTAPCLQSLRRRRRLVATEGINGLMHSLSSRPRPKGKYAFLTSRPFLFPQDFRFTWARPQCAIPLQSLLRGNLIRASWHFVQKGFIPALALMRIHSVHGYRYGLLALH